MFQPVSSAAVAGSFVLPVAKVAVAPPTREAMPFPKEGAFVPVLALLSGGRLSKSQSVITVAWVDATTRKDSDTMPIEVFIARSQHLSFWLALLKAFKAVSGKEKVKQSRGCAPDGLGGITDYKPVRVDTKLVN